MDGDGVLVARWFATSTQILRDPKMVKLGDKHGGAAISVVIALFAEAMLQEKGGTVEYAYRNLAHDAFTDSATAEAVVADAAESGFLELIGGDEASVEVHFPAWSRHQANYRKAKSRASDPSGEANVTACHEHVTVGHKKSPTGQDRRREENTGVKTTSGKPSEFDSWLEHYQQITGRATVTGSKSARQAFKARRKEGRSLDDLKAATVGCHSDEFCRTGGHDVPETILRASKVERYIALSVEPPKSGSAGVDRANEFADRAKSLRAKEAT